jgi:HTH-type transcriptional regulator, sugar sensing transcriptional regulator
MDAATALAALGFTETEALVYCELLRASPASGYRLAQAIGKAPANTYQALAALTQKGAVLVDDSAGKSFRPAPPAELIAALERAHAARAQAAQDALARLYRPPQDDRIYQIGAAAQVMERARAMIDGAREILLFDLFPGPFEALRAHLERAHSQGVRVAGVGYADAGETVFPLIASKGSAFANRWPGLQLSLVADAREYMVALLSHDGARVLHGVWSDSAYLSALQHNALASEVRLSALAPSESDDLADISLLRARPAGLRRLVGDEPLSIDAPIQIGDAA